MYLGVHSSKSMHHTPLACMSLTSSMQMRQGRTSMHNHCAVAMFCADPDVCADPVLLLILFSADPAMLCASAAIASNGSRQVHRHTRDSMALQVTLRLASRKEAASPQGRLLLRKHCSWAQAVFSRLLAPARVLLAVGMMVASADPGTLPDHTCCTQHTQQA